MRELGLIFLLALLWGPSFLFIKVALREIGPFNLVLFRIAGAAAVLLLFVKIRKLKMPSSWGEWRHFFILGFFAHALPFALFNWSELHIDSALAAILNGTTPLFTILIASVFIANERLSFEKVAGVIVGFVGLVILIMPNLTSGAQSSFWGCMAGLGAALSYAVAMIYAKLKLKGASSIVAPAAQLSTAALLTLPVAFFFEGPVNPMTLSPTTLGAVASLALLGTAFAFMLYYAILEKSGPTSLSLVTYIVPVFGVVLGVVILDEKIGWHTWVSCALIFSGIIIVNRGRQLLMKLRPQKTILKM